MFPPLNNHILKFLLFFLTIFALQSVLLLILLLRPQISSAAIGIRVEPKADYNSTCPCGYSDNKKDAKKETVRLFVPIPGVTDACGYLCDINNDQKGDMVDYIVSIYKFLVSLAAVVAVFMIMVGGYQWIFAAGNTSRVANAKETIWSALLGLVLAMVSVQMLQVINPRLTDVALPEVAKIGRVSLGDYLCGEDDVLSQNSSFNSILLTCFIEADRLDSSFGELCEGVEEDQCDFLPCVQGYQEKQFNLLSIADNLISGIDFPKDSQDILKCDNVAMSYLVEKRNPSGPEMKIAHINWHGGDKLQDESPNLRYIDNIECFYGLCDEALVGKDVAKDNKEFLQEYVTQIGYQPSALPIDKGVLASYSTKVESKGGGCYGSYCDPKESSGLNMCLNRGDLGIDCWELNELCKRSKDQQCDSINQLIQQTLNEEAPFSCTLRTREWLDLFYVWEVQTQHCVLGTKLGCPAGYEARLDYLGKQETINDGDQGCWEEGKDQKVVPRDCGSNTFGKNIYPTMSAKWAIEHATAMCCQKIVDPSDVRCLSYFKAVYLHFEDVAKSDKISDYYPDGSPFRDCEEQAKSPGSPCDLKWIQGKVEESGTCTEPLVGRGTGARSWLSWLTTPQPLSGGGSWHRVPEIADGLKICQPNEPKHQVKLCHRGDKDKIVYADLNICAAYNGNMCNTYLVPLDYPCLSGASGITVGGAGGFSAPSGGGGIAGAIKTLTGLSTFKSIVQTQGLKAALNGQEIDGQEIDPCLFVTAMVAQESGGNPTIVSKAGACGLIQVMPNEPNCHYNGKDLLDPEDNLTAGINELTGYLNDPCGPGADTACLAAKNGSVPGAQAKKYRYALADYNGGKDATTLSGGADGCLPPNDQDCCTESCKSLADRQSSQRCLIEVDTHAIMPTKVECPIAPGELGTETYPYIFIIESNYQSILNDPTAQQLKCS